MSKIIYSFMQRYTHNLDTAIKNYITARLEGLSRKTYESADDVLDGYTASNDITVSKMVVTTVGSVVTVMIGFRFNNGYDVQSDKILISGFPTPKGEVSAISMEQNVGNINNVYLNLTGNLVSRAGIYGTDTNWIGFTYIQA